MNKRSLFLIAVTVILGATYAYFFTDWFKKKQIQISFRTFPGRAVKSDVEPIIFLLDKQYKLTSIKVLSVDEALTNKLAHPLWHLISDTNSVPVTDFHYGERVKGMKPSVPKIVAEKLVPDARYRIIVDAGKIHGEREFVARAAAVKAQ
ncbi:MAG: hypothetical protein H7X97_10605 [Opitutaceae bacterium]|nr:hypothetical protein [Verrucomicrobiales bacterium]